MKGESKQWDTRRKGHLKSEEELFEREVFIATYEFAVVGDLDCGWEADRDIWRNWPGGCAVRGDLPAV